MKKVDLSKVKGGTRIKHHYGHGGYGKNKGK